MKRSIYILIILLFVSALTEFSTEAQNNLQIHRDFMQLKNRLLKIWSLVQKFQNNKAKELMADAKILMDEAEDYIYRRKDLSVQERIVEARKRMVEAKLKGELASRIVLQQPIQRLKAQLDDLINRADIEVSKNYSDEARYLINQAKKFRRRAYDAAGQNRIQKAQEYYQVAFFFANKVLNVLQRKEGNINNRINDFRSNLQLLLIQVEDLVNNANKPIFSNLLDEAKKHFAQAVQLFEDGNKEIALRRFKLIEKLIYRIMDQMDRKSLTVQDRLENDLYSLKALLDALQSEIGNNPVAKSKSLFDKAYKLYGEATRLFETDNHRQAELKISLSHRIATKLLQFIKRQEKTDTNNISTQLQDAHRLLDMQANPVEQSGKVALQKMHSEAKKLLAKAQNNYDKNNNDTAFQYLQITTRITNKIQKLLNENILKNNVPKNELEKRLQRAKILITKLKTNKKLYDKHGNIIEQLEQFANRADEYLASGDYLLAQEYIKSLLQQINLYTNEWSKKTE